MCEMSLEETGLTRKRGAEILGENDILKIKICAFLLKILRQFSFLFLEHEFEKEWTVNGGLPYIKNADRKKNGKF